MRLSLRYRLLLPLTLLLLGDVAATGWAATAAASGAERRLAGQLWAVARTLTERKPTESRTFPLTQPVLEQMKGLSGAEFVLVRADGRKVTTLPNPDVAPPVDVPTATPAAEGEDHDLGPPVTVDGTEYRCLQMPLRPPHPNEGGQLFIFYPESLRKVAIRDAAQPPLILGGVGGLIAVGLAVGIGSGLVRRIRDLEVRTRLIAGGDFRAMPLAGADDEVKDLCRSVNDMARRLAEFQDSMQRSERLRVLGQFSGGLAHQLRNAAAGAKLAVEIFLAENPTSDPEPLRVALRQLARIESNLRQFLDLGKPPSPINQHCDIAELVDQAISLLRPQCQHAGIALGWKPSTATILKGDATQLGHLFGNLIGNAIEAATPGGGVDVRVLPATASLMVEIADTGPGPPSEIAAKMFEPFVTGKDQGIGLGLAVARQAVEAHGGKISWERREGRTVFRVELPL